MWQNQAQRKTVAMGWLHHVPVLEAQLPACNNYYIQLACNLAYEQLPVDDT
jgi:hypothetical protein